MARNQKGSAAGKGGDVSKQLGDTAQQASDTAQQAGDTAQQAGDTAQGAGEGAQQAVGGAGGQTDGLMSELKDVAREAALSVLKPVVKSVSQSAAQYAVTKGPDVLKDQLGPKLDEVGGLEGLADKALSNAGPAGKVASKLGMGGKLVEGLTGGDQEDGEADLDATGSGRRMPVQQGMYVAVPLEVAFSHWTEYDEYPNFMHRVDSASREDETHVTFTEKIWGFGRDFEAEIVEQRPFERIVWRSVNGLKHAGVVTFHEIAPRLSRIEVTVDFKPESLFQKFARGNRFTKRAIRADMHRFKAYVELKEETDDVGWLGRIEGGEVVEGDEEVREKLAAEEQPEESDAEGEELQAEEEEPEAEESSGEEELEEEPEQEEEELEASEEEELEASEEEEPEASEEEIEEEPEAEDEQPEEEEEAAEQPRRRQSQRQSGGGRRRPQRPSRPRRQTQREGGGQKRRSRQPSGSRRTAKSSAR
jgi:uncharacterized membrane protein